MKKDSSLGSLIALLVGIVICTLLVVNFGYIRELKSHRVLDQDHMIELIENDEHFDEALVIELRECIRTEKNYVAYYDFSWLGGDPEISFVFTLPFLDCPCGCGQLTSARVVKMDLMQKLFSGDWYTLKSSVEYEKGD